MDERWVVCLCAEWCGVCRQWHADFIEQARAHPEWRFAWVDVEDEADAMGDVEVETFPTVLVARGDQVLFLGPIPPSAPQLARLLAQPEATGAADPAARTLFDRLRRGVLPGARVQTR